MDEVLNSYILAFDEINALTTTSYRQASGEDVSVKIAQVTDDILSFLINAYAQGIQAASKMLAYDITVDTDKMRDAIYIVIDGMSFEDRIADHILSDDLAGLVTLAESEFHRVYNTAIEDGAKEFIDLGNFGVTKTWNTVKDDKVRETHSYLEGQSVSIEEEFYTFDDDHAPYLGGF